MAEQKNDILRRPLYIYGLPADVLSTLAPKDITSTSAPTSASPAGTGTATPSHTQTLYDESEPSEVAEAAEGGGASLTPLTSSPPPPLAGEACALCSLNFVTHADKRGHFKSDLHLFNLKQKLRGQPPVSEDEFERLVGNLDESLSGSEWSESDSEDDDNDNDDDVDNDDGGDDDSDTRSKYAESTASTSTSTNVLANLLKKQAVLAEKRRTSKRGNDDGDEASDNGSTATAALARANRPKNHKQRQAAAAATAYLQPFVWFSSPVLPENSYFGAYRAMFTAEELGTADKKSGVEGAGEEDETTRAARLLAAINSRQLAPMSGPPPPSSSSASSYAGRHIFLCMVGGGHFAAMVIALAPRKAKAGSVPMNREATVLAHKTFHRYTTRRKQGGSQAANDAAKGAAHSAGSSLRRYNEQALVEDVRALLRDWKALLDSADLLFVRAAGTSNQRTIFGPYEGQVLQPRDPRLRSFPFNTRRPTQKEIMRSFIELTRLKVREIAPPRPSSPSLHGSTAGGGVTPVEDEATRQQRLEDRRAAAKRAEEEETALLHTTQLQALARRSKVPALLAYLKSNDLSAATFRFSPADAAQHHHAPTLLHYAASQNASALVGGLLLRAGADPAVPNGDGKTPFELAGDRPTRDAFRVARSELAGSSSLLNIDWDAARVPAPITRVEAEQREAREKEESARKETERRRTEEARLREEAAADSRKPAGSGPSRKRMVGVLKSAQEIRDEEARGLTPEQRQRLERERRARAAEARMRQLQEGQ